MSQEEPKYQQVKDWVKDNISRGSFRAGEKMMSEKELAEKFGLSRQTIRRATGELAAEGFVTRVQGSGTYIGRSGEMKRAERYMSIAVVSTFYESYIFPPTLKGIERVLSRNGYTMQVSFTDNKIKREEVILRNLLEKDNIDGLIVEPAKSSLPNPNLACYRELKERGIPILCFNTKYPDLDVPCVRMNDELVAAKATKLLLSAGHRRIAGIFKPDDGQGRCRYEGFMRTVMAADVPLNEQWVIWLDTTDYRNIDSLEEYIFARMEGTSAVLCYNDEVASRIIEMAIRRGLRVPEQLSVIGIDDSYLAGVSRVPFTSFPHPKEQLGRKAAENILALIRDPGFDANYLFDSEAVLRDSVAVFNEGKE